jgi:alpha-glucuronidase
MITKIFNYLFFALILLPLAATAQTDKLWLDFKTIDENFIFSFSSKNPTFDILKRELNSNIPNFNIAKKPEDANFLVVDNSKNDAIIGDGFVINADEKKVTIEAKTSAGALYGVYEYLRLYTYGTKVLKNYVSNPAYQIRILNHWDNPDGSVERGYAGKSIWFEGGKIHFRSDIDTYARANASVGINGTVIDNVNADPKVLSSEMLRDIKTIADRLRPYNIKVYLAVNFSSPSAIGGLKTSDPLDADVIDWWTKKCNEIYKLIPDFGGFLVKANSEGLPGPMDFGRTHADGANMLAKALKPHGGIVMWRAFVYNPQGGDRAKQAYDEFMPLDGKFDDNVIIQIKNGPIDFQPREPFSPLFGAMKNTQIMAEVQITQEYLGYSDHLCYLATMWKEFLDYPTFHNNKTVEEATLNQKLTAFSGVANTGTMKNWCGYVMAQSNWYAFGRLAWNPRLTAKQIAEEWIKQTITNNEKAVKTIADIMMHSREAITDYMTPLGLHHLMGWSDHWGPEPWCDIPGAREDWMPRYYHKAAVDGIGFDRSSKGTNAVEQYQEPLKSMFDNPTLCPKEFVLWFHHLPWDYQFDDGNTLWQSLCAHYNNGVKQVESFQKTWTSLKDCVPEHIYKEVEAKLEVQHDEAQWWRDGCVLYFQTFSKMDIPFETKYTLDECKAKLKTKAYIERQKD